MSTNQHISNEPAEERLLASILIDPEVLVGVGGFILPKDFKSDHNRVIYTALLDMFIAGTEIDLLSLRQVLGVRGRLESAGGVKYLASLDFDSVDPGSVVEYAQAVKWGVEWVN